MVVHVQDVEGLFFLNFIIYLFIFFIVVGFVIH